jgi:cell division protein FtsI (penicillin-binding protein 3)
MTVPPFPSKPQRFSGREKFVAGLFVFIVLTFGARLAQLQIFEHARWRELAQQQMYNKAGETMPRGEIRDRNGNPMAITLPLTYAVGYRPQVGTSADSLANILGQFLPISDSTIRRKLDSKGFTYLARRVDWQVQQDLEKLNLPGIEFTREARRSYPATTAAGTVVGFANIDGIGQDGIERALDSLLVGDKREMLVWNDARRVVPAVMSPMDDAIAHSGANVYLTIDLKLQSILDKCMLEGLGGREFEKACAVLMDPHTGEVLGISTLPAFDPNAPGDVDGSFRRCWPVTDLFEPGSIFKIVTVGAGLEEGVVSAATVIDCEGGAYSVPGKVLHDAHPYDALTVAEVFSKSSNIGCAKIAERLHADNMYAWIQKFGFGSKTEVGILSEPAGIVPRPANWSGPTRSNLAIGHGISTTALQIVSAYSAIANGGFLMQPKLVKGLKFPSGEQIEFDPVALRPVISPETARELTRLMTMVVEEGTGKAAKIEGVAIAGKTGTAQKVNLEAKSYYSNRYVSSFAGFFPANDPKYVLIVVVDDPLGGSYYGGQISAPVFAAIAHEILEERYPNFLPDPKPTEIAPIDSSKNEVEQDSVEEQKFAFDTLKYANVPLISMPNVLGLPLRAAAERMQLVGLEVQLVGYGVVSSQYPPAGERVPQGFPCQVIAQPVAAAAYAVSR